MLSTSFEFSAGDIPVRSKDTGNTPFVKKTFAIEVAKWSKWGTKGATLRDLEAHNKPKELSMPMRSTWGRWLLIWFVISKLSDWVSAMAGLGAHIIGRRGPNRNAADRPFGPTNFPPILAGGGGGPKAVRAKLERIHAHREGRVPSALGKWADWRGSGVPRKRRRPLLT